MRKHFTLPEANILYGFATFLLILFSFLSANVSFIIYAFIAEVMVFIGPVVFMGKYMDIDLKAAIKLKSMTLRQWKYSFLFAVSMVPVSFFISIVSSLIFNVFGRATESALPVAKDMNELIMQIIVIGLITGISEEVFFRGMFLSAVNNQLKDKKKSVFIVAFLFAIMHFDVQNFINPLFLGIVFGFAVLKTESVFSSIISHITINAMVVIFIFLFSGQGTSEVPLTAIEILKTLITYGGIALFSSGFGYLFYQKLGPIPEENNLEQDTLLQEENPASAPVAVVMTQELSFLIPLGVVLFYCLLALYVFGQS